MATKLMSSGPEGEGEQDIDGWFRNHSEALLWYFRSKLGNRGDAEDMLQNTYLKVLKTFDPSRGNLEQWVKYVATSQRTDALRRRMVIEKHVVPPLGDGLENITTSNTWEQQLNWIALKIALEKLSKEQRAVLVLCRLRGWSHHQIAQKLGISEKRVRVLLSTALALLKGELCWGEIPNEAFNIDHDAAKWDVYITPSNQLVRGLIDNVRNPSRDGRALRAAIAGGDPYTNIHAYHTLPPLPIPTVRTFRLNLWWRFSHTTFANEGMPSSLQAIEMSFSNWYAGYRYEWSLQYMNVSDGSIAHAPAWRVWTGTTWLDTGIRQRLSPEHWHYFALQGNVTHDRKVRYATFTSDNLTISLGQTFAPVPAIGDKVTIALQLDGNHAEEPYDCIFDNVRFEWFTISSQQIYS